MKPELLSKKNLRANSHLARTAFTNQKGARMPQEIVFEEERLEYVLDALDRGIDDDGFVVDSEGEQILATDGEPIKAEDIGYIGHGSTDFVRDDISQIREYLHESD